MTEAENRGQSLHFFNGSTHERQSVMTGVQLKEDFVGAATMSIPLFTVASASPWGKHIVGSATVAKVADQPNGVVACSLTSASEAQTGALHQKNERNFTALKELVFEARVRATVMPTGAAVGFVGLGADYNANPESMTQLIGFSFRASGALHFECDDAVIDTSTDTGITVTVNQWYVLRAEILEAGTVVFYVDGVEVGSAPFAATGADAVLQPVVQVYKGSSTPVGTLEVDYISGYNQR